MAETARPIEINGLVFASTADGHLLESEVRAHVETLQREITDLRARLEHVTSLERLAQATVIKADELAAAIEAEARRRVEQMTDACETELIERRRQFEVETSAQQAAAQARVAQLQSALEGTLQTLGRALQAAGAPALEMPAASAEALAAPPTVAAAPAPAAAAPIDAAGEPSAVARIADDEPHTSFGMVAQAPPLDTSVASTEPEAPAESAHKNSADWQADEADKAVDPGSRDQEVREAVAELPHTTDLEREGPSPDNGAASEPAAERGGSGTFGLTSPARSAPEPTPIRPSSADRADDEAPAAEAADAGPNALSRTGPATLEIDMRPVKSFADLARVTKLLGRIAPGAQPVDLNLPQHRALFSVRGKDSQALVAQLQEALPEARVVERAEGIDVLLEGGE
jgi:hypothetical protein